MHRVVESGDQARQNMKAGLDWVADTVKVTMGVKGKNVVLDTNPYGRPLITNDGVTIARDLFNKDRTKNIGVKLVKEAAEKTNDNAGDGTTTTMILMQAIVEQGMRALANGIDGIDLRKGITKATQSIVDYLKTEKVDASDEDMLAATATISCRDAELGGLVAEVVKQAGKDGMVTIEDRFETDTTYEKLEGLKLTGGYLIDSFINLHERLQTVFNDVPILVTNRTITLGEEMGKIMETVANMQKKEAVVIAAGIEGDAMATAYVNWQKKAIFVLPVRVFAYGDLGEGMLKDVAAITGATYLDQHEKGLMDITAEDFGRATKTVTDKHNTTVVSDSEELKSERIKQLESARTGANEFEKENLNERIAKLSSGMFTIKVGGKTETDRNELKTRVDDAIKAAKAALEDGVIAGGGSGLYRAMQGYDRPDITTDEGVGESLVLKACAAPITQMAQNSNVTLDRSDLKAVSKFKDQAIDFTTGNVVNAFKSGIIDPLKVVTESLENAATQAGLFLTIEKAVYDVQEEKPEQI